MQNLTQILMQQWGRADVRQVFNKHSLMLTSSAMLAMLLVGCGSSDDDETVAEVDISYQYSFSGANAGDDDVTVVAKVDGSGLVTLDSDTTGYSLQKVDFGSDSTHVYVITYENAGATVALGGIGYEIKDTSKDITAENLIQIEAVVLDVDYEAGKSHFVVSESAVDGAVLQIWEHSGTDWATNWALSKVPAGQADFYFTVDQDGTAVTYKATYEDGIFAVLQVSEDGETETATDFVFVPVVTDVVFEGDGTFTMFEYYIYETQENADADSERTESLAVVNLLAVEDGTDVNVFMGQGMGQGNDGTFVVEDSVSKETYMFSAVGDKDGDFSVGEDVTYTVKNAEGTAVADVDLELGTFKDAPVSMVHVFPADGFDALSVSVNTDDVKVDDSHNFLGQIWIYNPAETTELLGIAGSVVDVTAEELGVGVLQHDAENDYVGVALFEQGGLWVSYDSSNEDFESYTIHDFLHVGEVTGDPLTGGFDSGDATPPVEKEAPYNFNSLQAVGEGGTESFAWDHFAIYDEADPPGVIGLQFNVYVDGVVDDDGKVLSITQSGADVFAKYVGEECADLTTCTVQNGDLLSFSYGAAYGTTNLRDDGVLPVNGGYEFVLPAAEVTEEDVTG